jgi:hypothetical protein
MEERLRKEAADAEARRRYEEAKRREERLRLERELEQARIAAARREAERQKREEAAKQAKLRQMGVCVQGFQWIKQAGGYRCAGGAHFIHDSQLR